MAASDARLDDSAGSNRNRLLLVDDEPELRRVFRRTLSRAGFEVVEAADGQDALALSRQSTFDLVVSDVCMPHMNGLELLERLVREAPDLPVLFVSGSTDLMDVSTALACGAFDFLQKPVDLAELRVRAARGVEEHQRRLRSGVCSSRESETRLLTAARARRPARER